MKCDKCGYDDKGTGDFSHYCGTVNLKLLAQPEQPSQFGSSEMQELILAKLVAQPKQPEQDVDYWIKQHTEARQAELSTRRELEALKVQPEQAPVDLRTALAKALTSVYVCGRVWDAWSVGTMTEDDFQPASECEEVLDSLIEAVSIAASPLAQPEPLFTKLIAKHEGLADELAQPEEEPDCQATGVCVRSGLYVAQQDHIPDAGKLVTKEVSLPEQEPVARCCLHDSDCSVHNMPAYPAGRCDCTQQFKFFSVTGKYERQAFVSLSGAEAYCKGLNTTYPEGNYIVRPLLEEAVAQPEQTQPTGWDNGLSQDYDKKLGAWFSEKPNAKQELRVRTFDDYGNKIV
jgi:hypothetical protein